MKKIYLLALLMCMTVAAFAQQRNDAKCRTIAQQVLNSSAIVAEDMKMLCTSNEIIANSAASKAAKAAVAACPLFYVYGNSNGAPGFVIVSADETMPEVLGYSKTGYFDADAMPDAARELLAMYAQRALNGDMKAAYFAHTARKAVAEVKPLLGDIAFNQRQPYNDRCPLYNGSRCLVGCTAIAMAQIMAYYKYPERMDATKGEISYTTLKYDIEASWDPASTVFDWNNICDTYSYMPPAFDASTTFENTADFTFSGFTTLPGFDFIVMKDLSNTTTSSFTGNVQLLLKDANDVVKGFAAILNYIDDMEPNSHYASYFMAPAIDSSLPDGTYKAYVVTRRDGEANWSVAKNSNGGPDFIDITKHGNTFSALGLEFLCGYNATQADAVATLCGACAHSLHADFGTSATSGDILKMASALTDYMGYSDRMDFITPEYFTTDGWHEYLQNEMDEKRPIFVSGYSSDSNSAHAFVIDGYEYRDDIPYYHVNWGWNGRSNAYFLIDYLKPSEAGDGGAVTNYGEEVYVITGIRPSYTTSKSCQIGATSITVDVNEVNPGEYIIIRATGIGNRSTRFVGYTDIYAYAINGDGQEYNLGKWSNLMLVSAGSYYPEEEQKILVPQDLPGGEYTIELRSLEIGCDVETKVISPSSPTIKVIGDTDAVDAIANDVANGAAAGYDIIGRKTDATTKGIVITNGTKVVKK